MSPDASGCPRFDSWLGGLDEPSRHTCITQFSVPAHPQPTLWGDNASPWSDAHMPVSHDSTDRFFYIRSTLAAILPQTLVVGSWGRPHQCMGECRGLYSYIPSSITHQDSEHLFSIGWVDWLQQVMSPDASGCPRFDSWMGGLDEPSRHTCIRCFRMS